MSDIVHDLLNWMDDISVEWDKESLSKLTVAAAEEIERLRGLLREWREGMTSSVGLSDLCVRTDAAINKLGESDA